MFTSPLGYAPIHTHPHQSTSIYNHMFPFLPNITKHDVRGNFPGHIDTKYPEISFFHYVYLVFAFPCVSCTPPHPSAPMNTHLHPLTPVYNLNYNLYMYNLIEKYYLNYIKFQIFKFNIVSSDPKIRFKHKKSCGTQVSEVLYLKY